MIVPTRRETEPARELQAAPISRLLQTMQFDFVLLPMMTNSPHAHLRQQARASTHDAADSQLAEMLAPSPEHLVQGRAQEGGGWLHEELGR